MLRIVIVALVLMGAAMTSATTCSEAVCADIPLACNTAPTANVNCPQIAGLISSNHHLSKVAKVSSVSLCVVQRCLAAAELCCELCMCNYVAQQQAFAGEASAV